MGKKNIVWNDYISQDERFADFFNGVLFQGQKIVDPEALTQLDSKLWRRNREIHKEEYEKEEGFDMCLAIREMIRDGRMEGKIEGREEGKNEGWTGSKP